MESSIQTIEKLVAELQSLQPLKTEYQQRLDKKIRLEFNYNSNHIEGNTLTYGETKLLLIFDKTTNHHDFREYDEMKSHDLAFEMIKDWAKDQERPLSEMAIKNLHQLLLVRPFWKEAVTPDGQPTRRQINPGTYKEHSNSVRLQNGEMFHYASPAETPLQMGELIEWFRVEEEKGELHPVALAALLHYKFVCIHPFDDGNGRISRLLMNYVLLRNNLPPVVIKSSDKKGYLFALNQADTGNLDAFIEYIVAQLIWSLELSIKAGNGKTLEEEDDWEKKLQLLKNKVGASKEVTVKRGKEGYKLAMENTLLPFLSNWEGKLQKIDPLFNSRSCRLAVNGNFYVQEDDLIKAIHKCFDKEGTSLVPAEIREIKITVGFSNLRTEAVIAGFNGGEASIIFGENAISIATITNQRISKLYSEVLSDEEAETLTNSLGSWFMNHLEEYINKQ